jgi:hypothetical protein
VAIGGDRRLTCGAPAAPSIRGQSGGKLSWSTGRLALVLEQEYGRDHQAQVPVRASMLTSNFLLNVRLESGG